MSAVILRQIQRTSDYYISHFGGGKKKQERGNYMIPVFRYMKNYCVKW